MGRQPSALAFVELIDQAVDEALQPGDTARIT
jgi:hypothetical protein